VFVKNDIKATLEVMKGFPVTIRLLDPPLHEFVPHTADKLEALGRERGVDMQELHKRADSCVKTTRCSGIAASGWE